MTRFRLKHWIFTIFLVASILVICAVAWRSLMPRADWLIAQMPTGKSLVEEVQPITPDAPQSIGSSDTSTSRRADSTAADQPRSSESSSSAAPADTASPPPTGDQDATPSAGPYDMEAIKAFNRALYGS